jgi:hypothetical protein
MTSATVLRTSEAVLWASIARRKTAVWTKKETRLFEPGLFFHLMKLAAEDVTKHECRKQHKQHNYAYGNV